MADVIRSGDRAIPAVHRGPLDSISKRLAGTENEVWTKYLQIMGRHRAMTPDDWMRMVEEAGKTPAKAYS